jgi:hypothetical protein
VWKESQLHHLEPRSEASIKFQNFPFGSAQKNNKIFQENNNKYNKKKIKKIKPPAPPFSAFNIVEKPLTR